jgi:chaperonin GroEL
MAERILKSITSNEDAKIGLLNGINTLADVVSSTYGYRGRTVLIETPYGMPEPTKDGYKTLQSIFLEDPIESMACEIAKQASQRTVDLAGDATTCTIVLLQAIFSNSLNEIRQGKSPIDVKNSIEKSRDLVLKYLDEISITKLTEELIYSVALTSANGEKEIAKIVADAFIKSGEYGSVSHLRSVNEETYLDYIEGTLLEAGLGHELLVNNFSERTCELDDNPLIVCSNIIFKTWRQIEPFLNFAVINKRQIAIIADWSDSQSFGVRDTIISNVLGGNLKCALINLPSFGNKRRDFVSDIALLCGTQLLSSLSGDDFVGREGEFMGTCKKITSGKTDTIILPYRNDEVHEKAQSKINELKSIATTTKNQLEKKYVKERISKLSGGVSMIYVGSIIESELQEKIDRVDDAVCAVRSAKEEGVLAGGGIALYNASFLNDLDLVSMNSLKTPLYKILLNANSSDFLFESKMFTELTWFGMVKSKTFEYVKKDLKKYPFGYDVKEYKECNMIEVGIIDATKAIKHALINAVSASNTLIMTDHVVTNRREIHERKG